MRELSMGDKQVRVRATALALLFYKQQFKSDLIGDIVSLQAMGDNAANFDSVKILQMIWAMAKADTFGQQFPSFEAWLSEFDSIDFSDVSFINAALDEAKDGFFRGAGAWNK